MISRLIGSVSRFRTRESGKLRALTEREEKKMAADPGYRSSRAVLRRLAHGNLLYEVPPTKPGEWATSTSGTWGSPSKGRSLREATDADVSSGDRKSVRVLRSELEMLRTRTGVKGTDRVRMLGAVVGKALGRPSEGEEVIEVLLTLQAGPRPV